MEDKKKVIVEEIKYWKKHQLLPSTYCDFLIALYTEGEDGEGNHNNSAYYLIYYFISALSLLIPFILFSIGEGMLIHTIGVFTLVGWNLCMIHIFNKHECLMERFAIIIFFITFLMATMIWCYIYIAVDWLTLAWAMINVLSWIFYGVFTKQSYLQIMGVFMFIILMIATGFYYF
ncbi:hypothetical protein [Gracilibacillus sp. YIM 98692]|uniref:hypothetical protein n=1 Tax=Gracilibacillus sp. YIM 98692 TaxID=2663532 RepID=UPI0013D00458|nr:hypothetical protein [Gracilibacillus sp. YIM 98692]